MTANLLTADVLPSARTGGSGRADSCRYQETREGRPNLLRYAVYSG